MKIYGTTEESLAEIAHSLDMELYRARKSGKNAVQFTLRPLGERFRKIAPSGRRVYAVCWHGHYRFFKKVLEGAGTRVVTSLAKYDSIQALTSGAGRSDVNKGNMINPVAYSECCKCRPSIMGL
jgi:hypothetical protein